MDTLPPEVPFLSTIGLMVTYRCTIACPHCIVEAGPHRKEEMQLELAKQWLKQASQYRGGRIKGLALTGGEPFYNPDYLAQLSTYARTLGLVTSVVTNAFWASSKSAAVEVLTQVPCVEMVSISTDIYHQRAIPFAYVENAIAAAKELHRSYVIAVCTDNQDEPQYKKIIEELTALGETDRISETITFPVGRAQKQMRHFHFQTSPNPAVGACTMAAAPIIFPDGHVNACIGPLLTLPPIHPLFLGSLHEETLADILDRAELNPFIHAIRVWGPHRLVAMLKQYGRADLLPGEYVNKCICDTCYKLLSSPSIIAALNDMLQEESMCEVIAYARIYYLNEPRMAELYHLPS